MNRPGAAYMTIRNTGDEPVTLIGLTTPLAMMPEIHETKTNAEGVSSMNPAGRSRSPRARASRSNRGLHAMPMRLQELMTEGDTFPLTLLFEDGGEVTVEVPILGIAARGPED